jgi:hypothetical protein
MKQPNRAQVEHDVVKAYNLSLLDNPPQPARLPLYPLDYPIVIRHSCHDDGVRRSVDDPESIGCEA